MFGASSVREEPKRGDHELLRGNQYAFLARLLGTPPSADLLTSIAGLQPDETPLGQAYSALARKAAQTTAQQAEQEFFDLFIGVGRGELLPYASFYLTGFLNERPLADLRGDLARLGVERAPGRHESEDHIAFICEVMGGLATGEYASPSVCQDQFFHRHVAPWAPQFFDDLAIAPSADFYRPLAEIGRIVVDIDERAFALGRNERGRDGASKH